MSIRTAASTLICAAILLHIPGRSAQALQNSQAAQQRATKPTTDMSSKCQAMKAEHDKVVADMTAADQRLDDLVAKMNAASGQAKVDATAAVVTEIVAQRKTMRDRMMKMQDGMMGHMMEHM
jgi:peptidoglycan hydrolase CwlO-like protein